MIIEDYVSFEVAKLLKEKGFDEPCIAVYEEGVLRINTLCYYHNSELSSYICAPTLQMSMKWLREVHHIIFVFKPSYFSGDECTYWTYERWCGDNFDGEVLSFKTYEEACEAALKYCLENLI